MFIKRFDDIKLVIWKSVYGFFAVLQFSFQHILVVLFSLIFLLSSFSVVNPSLAIELLSADQLQYV